MKKAIALTLMAVVLVSMLVSCGGKSVVGKWQLEEDGETIIYEFKKDGKLEMITGGMTVNGSYTVNGDELTITISFMGMEETNSGKFGFEGDNLILYNDEEDGENTVLKPVK